MHGLGNDYVVISLLDQEVADPSALARAITDRRRGVGADGLILAGPPQTPEAHLRMIMFNPDGSRAQMCGNGIRCLAKLAWQRGWAKASPLRVQTDHGVRSLDLILNADGGVDRVRVDMGEPILDPARIPVALEGERVVGRPIPVAGRTLTMTCVSMGNPHAVFFVPDLQGVPLATWGPLIEHDPRFPQRVNAHFVQVLAPDLVRMITWERGAGITSACGTGASAVCVAGVLNGLIDRKITAELAGGHLEIEWDPQSNRVFMTGPAVEVFTGCWPG